MEKVVKDRIGPTDTGPKRSQKRTAPKSETTPRLDLRLLRRYCVKKFCVTNIRIDEVNKRFALGFDSFVLKHWKSRKNTNPLSGTLKENHRPRVALYNSARRSKSLSETMSGKFRKNQEFLAKHQTLFYLHGDQELQRRITPMSNDGFCTVVKGVRVHFSQL